MEDVPMDVLKATQNSLGKYVKKPPLTEKLLKKPPFRFLHDIITTVIKSTGFFEGLFDQNELVSDNVKDRESKVLFLNKVITVLVNTTGKHLDVKPNKIVAGQEPQKTNELLQLLADALEKQLSSTDAVNKYRSGQKQKRKDENKSNETEKQPIKSNNSKKLKSRSSEKLLSGNKNPNTKNLDTNKQIPEKSTVHQNKDKNSSPPKVKTHSTNKKLPLVNNNKKQKSKSNIELDLNKTNSTKREEQGQDNVDNKSILNEVAGDDSNKVDDEVNAGFGTEQPTVLETNEKLNSSYTISTNALNSDLPDQELQKDSEQVKTNLNDDNDPISQDSLQQSNDQKQANEIASKHSNINNIEKVLKKSYSTENQTPRLENIKKSLSSDDTHRVVPRQPPILRPLSSRPGAPRLKERHENVSTVADNVFVGKVNIIEETTAKIEEEDTGIVILDPTEEPNNEMLQASLNQHGHLVQQILESQKELSQTHKTEIEWQVDANKAKEYVNQEMEQVRMSIQALSRVANPLGKLLDHVQEDVEVMRQELEQWKLSFEETSKELTKQKMANEDSLSPLYTKSQQLDSDIREKRCKIDDLKLIIYKNKARIDKLLQCNNLQ